MKHAILTMVLLASCGGGDDDGQQVASVTMTGIATQPTDTNSDCEAGTEGCRCDTGGSCMGELVCASQLCVDFDGSDGADEGDTEKPDPTADPSDPTADPTVDPTADPTSGETGDGEGSCEGNCGGSSNDGLCRCDTSCLAADDCCDDYGVACGGGAVACLWGADCEIDEVCTPDLECAGPWGRTYLICVSLWADYSPTCWDFDDCYADAYFSVFYGGDLVFKSETHDDTVMTAWDDCAEVEINSDIDDGFQSNEVLSIVFSDEDGLGANDPMNIACYAEDGECTFVPIDYLHDGFVAYGHDANYTFDVQLRFTPVD